MVEGIVTDDGTPVVKIPLAGTNWVAVVDSGFNGDLELPDSLRQFVNARFEVEVVSQLAGNQQIREYGYSVDFPFDGRVMTALATFVPGDEILLGTGLLREYRLEIDFPAKQVQIERLVPAHS